MRPDKKLIGMATMTMVRRIQTAMTANASLPIPATCKTKRQMLRVQARAIPIKMQPVRMMTRKKMVPVRNAPNKI